jgi:hypothetical protein
VGDLHIAVTVDEPQTNRTAAVPAPTNLGVQIAMASLDHPSPKLRQRATLQTTFFLPHYDSDFSIPSTGQWEVAITVTSSAGAGTARFVLEVLPHQRINWELVFWITLALLAMIWVGRVTRTSGK